MIFIRTHLRPLDFIFSKHIGQSLSTASSKHLWLSFLFLLIHKLHFLQWYLETNYLFYNKNPKFYIKIIVITSNFYLLLRKLYNTNNEIFFYFYHFRICYKLSKNIHQILFCIFNIIVKVFIFLNKFYI